MQIHSNRHTQSKWNFGLAGYSYGQKLALFLHRPNRQQNEFKSNLIILVRRVGNLKRFHIAWVNSGRSAYLAGMSGFGGPPQPVDATLCPKRKHWIFCLQVKYIVESSPRNRSLSRKKAGSAVPMTTPNTCSDSTFPRAPIYRYTLRDT